MQVRTALYYVRLGSSIYLLTSLFLSLIISLSLSQLSYNVICVTFPLVVLIFLMIYELGRYASHIVRELRERKRDIERKKERGE